MLLWEIDCRNIDGAILSVCMSHARQQYTSPRINLYFFICFAVMLIFIREEPGNIYCISGIMIIVVISFEGKFGRRALNRRIWLNVR